MSKHGMDLWQGVDADARKALSSRNYATQSLAQGLSMRGVDAGQLAAADRNEREVEGAWIPVVEIFPRKIHPHRHRGSFGECARRYAGIVAASGCWAKQWWGARMLARSA